jgi:hypothetical protein
MTDATPGNARGEIMFRAGKYRYWESSVCGEGEVCVVESRPVQYAQTNVVMRVMREPITYG